MQRSVMRLLFAALLCALAASAVRAESRDLIYKDLRSQLFETDPGKIGITSFTPDHGIWGVVMEMGYTKGAATLVALADGTTSLYLETGGGIIGGGQHHAVKLTAIRLVDDADEFGGRLKAASEYPLPERDQIVFYFLTRQGTTKSQSVGEAELAGGGHTLSKLFYKCHGLIARLRQVEQN